MPCAFMSRSRAMVSSAFASICTRKFARPAGVTVSSAGSFSQPRGFVAEAW